VSLRIVLVTMIPEVTVAYARLLRRLGNEPVAVMTVANPRGRHGLSPYERESFKELVVQAPPELDLVVPSGRARIAPLLGVYQPDALLCVAFPWLIPASALAVPRLGCVNVHPSLLPRWRGPNPIAWTLRVGDPVLGLTYHRMDEHFDTGPILAQGSLPLDDEDTFQAGVIQKLDALGAELLPTAIQRLAAGDPGDPQPTEGATYAPRFEDEFVWLDWTRPAREIHNQVRSWITPSVSGRMGALATIEGARVRVWRTRLIDGARRLGEPGTVRRSQRGELLVQCGDEPILVVDRHPADTNGLPSRP
jgi:methionyl-tRNA formyltransferase